MDYPSQTARVTFLCFCVDLLVAERNFEHAAAAMAAALAARIGTSTALTDAWMYQLSSTLTVFPLSRYLAM
jgi:hypothetical protein